MEKRVLFAILLCIGVLFGWSWLQRVIWPLPPKPVAAETPKPQAPPKAEEPAAVPPPQSAPQTPQPAPPQPPEGGFPAKTVRVESERLQAGVSSLGGTSIRTLDVWGCGHHAPGDRSVAGDPGVVTAAIEGREGFLGVDLVGGGASALAVTHWDLVSEGSAAKATIERGDVRVETTLRPSADPAYPYHFEFEVTATNLRARPGSSWMVEVGGPWMPLHPQVLVPEDGVIIAPEGGSCEQLLATDLAKKLKEEPNHERRSEKGWRYVGVRSDFYLAALFPKQALPKETAIGFRAAKARLPVAGVPTDLETAQATLRIPFSAPAAGKSETWTFFVYAGPDSRDVIGVAGSPYEPIGDAFPNRSFLGLHFGPIARFLGWLLSHLANSVGLGWGMAVLTLTVLVRGLLFPLSRKTQISMRLHAQKMQKVKPRLDAIKAKFEGNTKKQQEETMKVFREEKLSILPGGCLLAFAQMPVWISLYATLQTTFEMRHAGFLWFKDLTAPDHLLEFPAIRHVMFIGDFTQGWLNLLPLLMMVTWYGSAAMQPLPEDPDQRAQAKMMRWIPLLFGFFLYRTAAGLTLYMTLSALWSIGESWLIRKVWLSKIELQPTGAAAAPALAAKKR